MADSKYSEEFVAELARNAYEHGAASFPIEVDRAALLVIDVQDEFVKPHWTPYWVPEATRQLDRIADLISHCRKARMPIIYTVFADTHLFKDRPRTGPDMPNRYPQLAESHDEWFSRRKVCSALSLEESDILICKPSYGAFYDTPLDTILRNLKRDTVVIAGTLTNYCCGVTARQAYERGYGVIFGSDVTSTDDAGMHEAELKVLRKGFARVLSADEIKKELS